MIEKINQIDQRAVIRLNSFLSRHFPAWINKLFGEWLIYLLPLILLTTWFYDKKSKKPAMRAFFSVILAWPILGNLIGHLVNRPRPFEADVVQELLFHRPTYSFPSDHAAAIFAIAGSFWFSGYKKLSTFAFVIGLVISFFRVGAAIHFPTDILGGLALGIFSAYIIYLFDKPLDIIYNFILKITSYLRLS